jgi:RecB family endonuclease NucS
MVIASRNRRDSAEFGCPYARRDAYRSVAMRLIVARCAVDYTGRLTIHLLEAVRLMLKNDGGVSIWHGGRSSASPRPETG